MGRRHMMKMDAGFGAPKAEAVDALKAEIEALKRKVKKLEGESAAWEGVCMKYAKWEGRQGAKEMERWRANPMECSRP